MKTPQKSNVILALDVSSSSTGFAVLRNGRWNKSSTSYGMIKIPSKLPLGERLVMFRDHISTLLDKVNPDSVVIEDVFSGPNVSTMKLLARFSGVAVEVTRRNLKQEPLIALTSKVRAFLKCGKKKINAFDYVCDRYNLNWSFNKMNDVTDAVCLALYLHGNKDK